MTITIFVQIISCTLNAAIVYYYFQWHKERTSRLMQIELDHHKLKRQIEKFQDLQCTSLSLENAKRAKLMAQMDEMINEIQDSLQKKK